MPNAKDLIVSVERPDETQFNMQLEEVSALTGKTRDITAGLYGYLGASLTRDGKQLVTVRFDKQTRFWFGDCSDLSNGHTRAADSGQYDSASWASDGNLVAQANRRRGQCVAHRCRGERTAPDIDAGPFGKSRSHMDTW